MLGIGSILSQNPSTAADYGELAGSAEEDSDGSDSDGGGYEDAKRITLTEVRLNAVPL